MDFGVLGPFEVLDNGKPVNIGPRQQRALLALLLINLNRVVSTDRILEDLWHDDVADKEKTLWVYISRLRATLEPQRSPNSKSSVLITRDRGYELTIEEERVDSNRFESMANLGRDLVRDDPVAAAQTLATALDLWRGRAYEDFAYHDFAQPEIDRLNEARLQATEDLNDARLRNGQHREIVGDLERVVRDHPLRERPIGLLMVSLYRSGRHAEALRAFQRYRSTLGEELGVEPSPELRTIEEQILLHDERLEPRATSRQVVPLTEPRNPFKGLQAFSEDDAGAFFGRERLITDVIRRLSDDAPLVALVGASGTGKSSVVRAGVIPAVRKGAVGDPANWRIATMVPGSRPFTELEAALLRSSLDAPESLPELSREGEDGLLLAGLRLIPEVGGRLLLVVDQFEELFTMVQSTGTRGRFMRNLEVALEDPHMRICVLIALRADFYHRPLEYPSLGSKLGDGVVNIVQLLPDELEAAAERPAAMVGVHLESKLLARLIADVAGQSGSLPHFQYALTELYERRQGSALSLEEYERMGGVSGAISRRAEDVYQTLDNDKRSAAKQLFLRLVHISEDGNWSRRRVLASEAVNIVGDTVDLQAAIGEFGRYRLLTFDRDQITGSPTVEVAHEALLSDWPRLREWIEYGREDVLRHAMLTNAIAEWQDSNEHIDYLLSGERLTDYERWAAKSTLQLNSEELDYLAASIAHRDREQEAESQRVARETSLGRKARRSVIGLTIALALLSVVVAAVFISLALRGPDIVVVHGVTRDAGVNELMVAGALAAEREHELGIERLEPLIDPEADLRRIAESGADLIVVSSDFDSHVEQVAPEFPEVHFVAIDPALIHTRLPNVTEVHFAVEESAFLAGAAAALQSRTGVVAFIGGVQSFRSEQSRTGFEQGARWADPEISVLSFYIGPVTSPLTRANRSPDLAHELASLLYAEGADVIFHDAGESGTGVVNAARDYAPGERWVIGSNIDTYLTASSEIDRDYILSSTIKRFDRAVEQSVAAFLAGSLQDGEIVLGLADDGVGLSREGGHLNSISGRLGNYEGDVALGHLTVFDYSLDVPRWQIEHDMIIEVEMHENSCTASVDGAASNRGTLGLGPGTVYQVDFVNHTGVIVGVGTGPLPAGTTRGRLEEEALVEVRPSSLGAPLAVSAVEPGARTMLSAIMPRGPVSIDCFIFDPYGGNSEATLPAAFNALILTPEVTNE